MKKFVALLLAVAMCVMCFSALADTYVSWYTYGDVYLSSVRNAMEAKFSELGITVNGSDSNGNQQTQSDFIDTALMTGADAVVVNLVESGSIGTAETIMNKIVAAGVPTVWFNRAVARVKRSSQNCSATELTARVGSWLFFLVCRSLTSMTGQAGK